MREIQNKLSQSFSVIALLTLSGGLQDAYSYFCRGGVFANAQTGNIVLLSATLVSGNYADSVKYLISITFFLLGVMTAKTLYFILEKSNRLFWKQIVLFVETAVLACSAFIPQSLNLFANALVSFACAMQVLTFDKIYGNSFASTMCIGNVVHLSDQIVTAVVQRDKTALKTSGLYLAVVVTFAAGASVGYLLQTTFNDHTILFSAALTFTAAIIFFFAANRDKQNNVKKETTNENR